MTDHSLTDDPIGHFIALANQRVADARFGRSADAYWPAPRRRRGLRDAVFAVHRRGEIFVDRSTDGGGRRG